MSESRSRKNPREMHRFKSIDEFIILEEIGKGGYGVVNLVEHKETQKKYALKSAFKFKKGKNKSKRTYMEIRVLQKLRHPNVVKLHGWFEDSEIIYLVLEYMSGKDLGKFFKGQSPDRRTIKKIAKQLIQSLIYIHKKKVIHRDIKLGNILIDDDFNIKLTDFGLCALKRNEYDMFNSHLGTARFISPEMISGYDYNESCDVWSLGVVLFKLLTGDHPFNGSSKESIFNRIENKSIKWYRYNLERSEVSLLKKLLRKDPDERMELEDVLHHPFFD